MKRPLHTLLLCCTWLAGAANAQLVEEPPPVGPILGGATNLGQGVQPATIPMAIDLGMTDFRDGMNWAKIETAPNRYLFRDARSTFPDMIADRGAITSLVVNFGNPLYDSGNTPESPEALAAMASYAGALIRRFPNVRSIEIGNEFNGTNFVRGPLEESAPEQRATAYTRMLRSVSHGIRSVDPKMRVLGGATHSLPGAWLWQIMDEGGGETMDALAIHPYTTPAEQFVRQIAVLRRHPVLRTLPLEVTEFGSENREDAGNHLLRNYCQFALAGVARAIWFPANLRGEKMIPLFTPKGRITAAGQAWQLAQSQMAGRPVQDAAPDDFTYGCLFGEDVLVLWGSPRTVTVTKGVTVTDAMGKTLEAKPGAPLALSETAPMVFSTKSKSPILPLVSISDSGLIADSFHQFAYPQGDEALAEGDAFERFARRDAREIALQTLPGQEAPGTPWYPYRGNGDLRPVRLTAETLVPGQRGSDPIEIVHRYTAPTDMNIRLDARFHPTKRSTDGVTVTLRLGGQDLDQLFSEPGAATLIQRDGLAMRAGDQLEIAVGPGVEAEGDVVHYRISLFRQ